MIAKHQFLFLIGHLFEFAEKNNVELSCFTFYRSSEQQLQEFIKGKSKIKSDGPHQKWLAMDLAISENNKLLFDDSDSTLAKYKVLGDFWKTLNSNCIWGGDFHFAKDIYHFELKEEK